MSGVQKNHDFQKLFILLKNRFEKFPNRHKAIIWDDVEKKLMNSPEVCKKLAKMEESGGEPDVVQYDSSTGKYVFFDCSLESPKERRSVCYDQEALEKRKEHKPKDSAMNMAKNWGIELLSEDQYRFLQTLGEFDLKTSSWVATPDMIRKLGGAIFCDRRYNYVFTYHNGADSYYAVRGWRGCVTL